MSAHYRHLPSNYSHYAPHMKQDRLNLASEFPYNWPHYRNTIPIDSTVLETCELYNHCPLNHQESVEECKACVKSQGGSRYCVKHLC